MGQCYEFGVAIHAGCGHAMRVGPTGGQCECPTCGAVCQGRFEGCVGILEQPGYIPVTAPQWAVDLTEAPPPTPTLPPRARLAGNDDHAPDDAGTDASVPSDVRAELDAAKAELRDVIRSSLAQIETDPHSAAFADAVERAQTRLVDSLRTQMIQSLQPTITDVRDGLLSATDSLRRELSDRDKELVDAFNRLADSYSQLSVVIESDRETTRVIVEGIARIARRVGRLERRLADPPDFDRRLDTA